MPKANGSVSIRESGGLPMAWKLDSLRGKTVLHLSEASKHYVSALRQVNSLGNLHVHTVKLGDAAIIISIFQPHLEPSRRQLLIVAGYVSR